MKSIKSFYPISCLLIFFLGFFSNVQAQEFAGRLSFQNQTFGRAYFIGLDKVSSSEFMEALSINEEAAKAFKTGRNMQTVGEVIGCIGAFCFGFDLGTRLGGGDGNVGLLAGGGGVMVGGLIMYFSGGSKMKKALNFYNSNSVDLSIQPVSNGLGLCLNF